MSLAARIAMQSPLAVCSDEEWLDAAELERLSVHAEDAWRPLADDQRAVVEVREDGTSVPAATAAHVQAVRDGVVDLVLLGDYRPYCPRGALAYVVGARGARILLEHGFPAEQRVDSLIRGLATTLQLRVRVVGPRHVHRPPATGNVKQLLPAVTLRTATVLLLVAMLVFLCAR